MPVIQTNDNIELLNEEVKEILGTPPKWIVRWGNMLLFIFFALLLIVATLVKRCERVSGVVTIIPSQAPVAVVVPLGSIINAIAISDGATVQKNQLLISYNYAGTQRKLLAPQAGTISFQRLMQQNTGIASDSLLMLIAPANQAYAACMIISEKDDYLIQPGQQVLLHTSHFFADAGNSISGIVLSKPTMSDNKTASVFIQLQTDANKPLLLTNTIKADAEITVSEKRLISTLFSF